VVLVIWGCGMERSEIQLWLRNPVTQWFFRSLEEEVWPTPEKWAGLYGWDQAVGYREREQIRLWMLAKLGSLEPRG
jgi:hypothetical protein